MTMRKRLVSIEATSPAGSRDDCPVCREWRAAFQDDMAAGTAWAHPPSCHPPRLLTAEDRWALIESVCELTGSDPAPFGAYRPKEET